MDTPKKIASALERVKKLANQHNAHIISTTEITRQDRELLTQTHWLSEITQGWYMLTRPDLAPGDSAAWYANYWDFLRIYLNHYYGNRYCLSAEASLALHTGHTVMSKQITVIVTEGGTLLKLPYETSILIYADAQNLPEQRSVINGIQVMPLPYALCKVTPTYFRKENETAEIALRLIQNPDELSKVILANNFNRAADRMIGAYQFLNLNDYVKKISETLKTFGIKTNPTNPFEISAPSLSSVRIFSSYANRIYLLWQKHRNSILDHFPKAPGIPKNIDAYLEKVDHLYEFDAYHSLSIEGYQVTPELIHRVQNNEWNPDAYEHDNQHRNALAARGYYEAFQQVKITLEHLLKGDAPGKCVVDDLSKWYQHLFAPSARANLISLSDLLGFRNDQVYIRNSRHAPPPKEALLDCMEAFFNCLQNEESPAVRAVLGHYIFVFIHPYMDGNGRIARFILNTMLASGGYPWTIIQVKQRKVYIDSLEAVHVDHNILPFTQFIIEEMKLSKKYY